MSPSWSDPVRSSWHPPATEPSAWCQLQRTEGVHAPHRTAPRDRPPTHTGSPSPPLYAPTHRPARALLGRSHTLNTFSQRGSYERSGNLNIQCWHCADLALSQTPPHHHHHHPTHKFKTWPIKLLKTCLKAELSLLHCGSSAQCDIDLKKKHIVYDQNSTFKRHPRGTERHAVFALVDDGVCACVRLYFYEHRSGFRKGPVESQ